MRTIHRGSIYLEIDDKCIPELEPLPPTISFPSAERLSLEEAQIFATDLITLLKEGYRYVRK